MRRATSRLASLAAAADVVDAAGAGPEEGRFDGPGVVVDVEPVPHVQAVPEDRQGLAFEPVRQEPRDELLRELAGAVGVRRAEDHGRQPEGHVVSPGQVVAARLAGRVGRGRQEGIGLAGGPARPAAVDLVGRDVDEGLDAREGPQGVEQDVGAVDVGQDELAGVVDRPVDVGLGGEVDDGLDPGEEAPDQVPVPDVAHDEFVAGVLLDVAEVVQVPGVGQLVQVDDPRLLVAAQEKADEVAADEARPARDEDGLAVEGPFRAHGRSPVLRTRTPPGNRASCRSRRGPGRT